jgi:hypothetical protein
MQYVQCEYLAFNVCNYRQCRAIIHQSMVRDQESKCTAGLYLAWPCVGSFNVKSCAPAQATTSSVNYQPFKGIDLNRAHEEDSAVATFGSRCQTMYISICHLLSYGIFSCFSLRQYLVYLVLIFIIFFRLINHNIRRKTSACIHHLSFTTFVLVANTSTNIENSD